MFSKNSFLLSVLAFQAEPNKKLSQIHSTLILISQFLAYFKRFSKFKIYRHNFYLTLITDIISRHVDISNMKTLLRV